MAYDDIFGQTDLRDGPKNALSISLDVDAKTDEAEHSDGIAYLLHTPDLDDRNEHGGVHHSHIRLHRDQLKTLRDWCQQFLYSERPDRTIICDEDVDRLAVALGSEAPLDDLDDTEAVLFHAVSIHAPERYHIPLSGDAVETLSDWIEQFLNEEDIAQRYRNDIERNKQS